MSGSIELEGEDFSDLMTELSQLRAELRAARADAARLRGELAEETARLDYLGYCCHGFVRGTDISKWSIEAPREGIRVLRAALDAARKQEGK